MHSVKRFLNNHISIGLIFTAIVLLSCRSISYLQPPDENQDIKNIDQIETGRHLLATIRSDPCIEDIVFGVPEESWRCQVSDSLKLKIPETIEPSTMETEELGDAFKEFDQINWDQAISHIGELITVCGPVVGSHYADSTNGQPTFLNIGKEYPDPERFTILIWGEDLDRFQSSPEEFYFGKNVCVSGTIKEYQGSLEIEVAHPNQIEIQQ